MILSVRDWSVWWQVLFCVQRNVLLKLRLGMADDTGPHQCTSHSWILGRVSFNCISQRAIDQGFDAPLTCVAVSLLSPLASSQVPAPRTTFTEAPSFEVCSAKVGPCHFVLRQHFSRGVEDNLSGPLPTWMSNALSLPSGDHGTARSPSILSASHLSDSWILLMFAERVLIAVPCSVTTTASDDESSIPTNTSGWNRGSHFHPLAGLAGMYKIFSPNSRIGVLSLRPCSLCNGVFPLLPDVAPFHQVRSTFHQPAQLSLRRAGLWFLCDAPTQLSTFWSGQQRVKPHVR